MDEQNELGTPHELPIDAPTPPDDTAPVESETLADGDTSGPACWPPPLPQPSPFRTLWRVVAVLATLAIVAAVFLGGVAMSVRANPQKYLERYTKSKPPTTLSVAGDYVIEAGLGGLSTKLDNSFTVDMQMPNRVRVEHGAKGKQHLLAISDGTNLTVDLGDGDSVARAPAPTNLAKLQDDPAVKKQLAEMSKVTGLDYTHPEKLNQEIKSCYVGVLKSSSWMRGLRAPRLSVPVTMELRNGLAATVWVNLATRQPAQVAYDITGEQIAKMSPKSKDGKPTPNPLTELGMDMNGLEVKLLLRFTSWRQDKAIAADRFIYQQPKKAKVNQAKSWSELPQALLGLPPGGLSEPEETKLTGQPAPNFTAKTLDGQSVSLRSLRGKPVVVDFWATWCPPCRRSMPVLDEVYKAHREQGLKVLGVSTDHGKDEVREFLKDNGVSFPVLWLDPASEAGSATDKAYGITSIPRTLFIDKDGIVRADTVGYHSAEAMAESLAKIGIK